MIILLQAEKGPASSTQYGQAKQALFSAHNNFHLHLCKRRIQIPLCRQVKDRFPVDIKMYPVNCITAQMTLQRILRMIGDHQIALRVRKEGIMAGAVDSFYRIKGKNRRAPLLPYGYIQ